MTTYTAECHREGRWWVVEVPELDKTTQVRRLDQVEEAVLSLVGLFTDEDASDTQVQLVLPAATQEPLTKVRQLRASADLLNAEASALMSKTARELADDGLTVRDIGAVLGVSFQRAQQLTSRA